MSPTRRVAAGTYGGGGRPVFQLGGASGYQGDWRRLRARASWGVSVVWIPPSWIGDRPDAPLPYDHLSEAGWVVGGTGPGASLGWVIDGAWSVGASVRAHGAALDPDGTGVELVPWISAAVGVELAR